MKKRRKLRVVNGRHREERHTAESLIIERESGWQSEMNMIELPRGT
jgi:hypothetical protein